MYNREPKGMQFLRFCTSACASSMVHIMSEVCIKSHSHELIKENIYFSTILRTKQVSLSVSSSYTGHFVIVKATLLQNTFAMCKLSQQNLYPLQRAL